MSNLPLYDTLIKNIPTIDLTLEEKRDLIKKINNLDNSGHEKIFMLIRAHGLKTKSGEIFSVPYGGKKEESNGGSCFEFNLEKLPIVVKQLIYKFVNIHLKSISQIEVTLI